jgi:hypothetical protein
MRRMVTARVHRHEDHRLLLVARPAGGLAHEDRNAARIAGPEMNHLRPLIT